MVKYLVAILWLSAFFPFYGYGEEGSDDVTLCWGYVANACRQKLKHNFNNLYNVFIKLYHCPFLPCCCSDFIGFHWKQKGIMGNTTAKTTRANCINLGWFKRKLKKQSSKSVDLKKFVLKF